VVEDGDNDNLSSADMGNPNTPHWDNDSASEGFGGGAGELTPVPPPPPQRRSSSILIASPDAAAVPPPPMTQQKVPNNKLTRRASTRLSAASMEALTSGINMPNMPGIPNMTSLPSSSNMRVSTSSVAAVPTTKVSSTFCLPRNST
jgi:hypothetical protein